MENNQRKLNENNNVYSNSDNLLIGWLIKFLVRLKKFY